MLANVSRIEFLAFTCPACSSPPGRGCVQGPRRKNKSKPHDERLQIAGLI